LEGTGYNFTAQLIEMLADVRDWSFATEPFSGHGDQCPLYPPKADIRGRGRYVRFSNRPVGVKRFQTVHCYGVDVAHGLVLLFGIGTKALPLWDSKTRWNNLWGGLAV
jgi:hypothetical protein